MWQYQAFVSGTLIGEPVIILHGTNRAWKNKLRAAKPKKSNRAVSDLERSS